MPSSTAWPSCQIRIAFAACCYSRSPASTWFVLFAGCVLFRSFVFLPNFGVQVTAAELNWKVYPRKTEFAQINETSMFKVAQEKEGIGMRFSAFQTLVGTVGSGSGCLVGKPAIYRVQRIMNAL